MQTHVRAAISLHFPSFLLVHVLAAVLGFMITWLRCMLDCIELFIFPCTGAGLSLRVGAIRRPVRMDGGFSGHAHLGGNPGVDYLCQLTWEHSLIKRDFQVVNGEPVWSPVTEYPRLAHHSWFETSKLDFTDQSHGQRLSFIYSLSLAFLRSALKDGVRLM